MQADKNAQLVDAEWITCAYSTAVLQAAVVSVTQHCFQLAHPSAI